MSSVEIRLGGKQESEECLLGIFSLSQTQASITLDERRGLYAMFINEN
jgi:hypothetical protein